MRKYLLITLTLAFCFLFSRADAQISSIKINNQSSPFSIYQGTNLSWDYHLPAGDSAHVEIWMDLNKDNLIDEGTDKLLYSFDQIDGDTTNMPGQFPDADNSMNGDISYTLNEALPPGNVIIYFYSPSYGQGAFALGTITGLNYYQTSVSGKVTAPSGKSSANLLVKVLATYSGKQYLYDLLTDSAGNYIVGNQSGGGQGGPTIVIPCQVSVEEPFAGLLSEPPIRQSAFVTNEQITGLDFSFAPVKAKVSGHLRDDDNTPLPWTNIVIKNSGAGRERTALTNGSGWYTISVDSADIPSGPFTLETKTASSTHMFASTHLNSISPNDSLIKDVIVYNANATISGTIVNSAVPTLPEIALTAIATGDSGYATAASEYATGVFSIGVSNKISTFNIYLDTISVPPVIGHPGDTGIVINIVTSVKEREAGVPKGYQLYQNFPNPFNPTTTVNYDIAHNSQVKMVLINMLGQEIAKIVDAEQPAGKYSAVIDASNLPSGVYFYRLQVFPESQKLQPFTTMRKMTLIK
jgi:hypothetical protein